MKKTMIIGLSLVVALALMATVVLARGPGRGYGMRPGYGYGYSAIPNLTAEQSSQLQALQKAHLDEIAPLQEELSKKETELRSLWLTPNPDQAAITSKQKEILYLRTELQEKGMNFRLEMRNLLTPEQQAQLSTHGSGFGPRMGKMGRGGRW